MKKIRALTLLELLVAIGISVLILAVSLPLFKYEKKGALVQNEAEMLASYLETARSLAIHPENENASAYRILNQDGTINTVRIDADGNASSDDLGKKLTLTYSIPTPANFTPVNFTSYSGEYSGDDADITLCLKNDASVCKTVKISKPGVINIIQP